MAAALERLPGVKRADVRLESGQAKVIYDDAKQTPDKLAAAIDRLGFQAAVLSVTDAPKPTLYVEGVSDRAAARRVEQALKAVKGVTAVTVDPGTEVYVQFDRGLVRPGDLVAAVEVAGFRARLGSP